MKSRGFLLKELSKLLRYVQTRRTGWEVWRSSFSDPDMPYCMISLPDLERIMAVGHGHMEFRELAILVNSFMRAQTPADGRRILEQHPELLGEGGRFVLDWVLKDFRAENNSEALFVLQQRSALLQRCREVGVEATFRELRM